MLHGKQVPSGYDVVQLTWVREGEVLAPVVLGDLEENRVLASGRFFCSSKITSCESKTGPLTLSVLTFANILFVLTLRVLVKLGRYFALKKTLLDLNGWWRV